MKKGLDSRAMGALLYPLGYHRLVKRRLRNNRRTFET